jgi:hypothetical protein
MLQSQLHMTLITTFYNRRGPSKNNLQINNYEITMDTVIALLVTALPTFHTILRYLLFYFWAKPFIFNQ